MRCNPKRAALRRSSKVSSWGRHGMPRRRPGLFGGHTRHPNRAMLRERPFAARWIMSDPETGDAYQFEFVSLEGEKLPLAAWRGRPVLVVNTASFCGYTPQYRDLEALWRRYGAQGLIVLGVPSNDFGEQEPGSEAEIRKFCETNYQVDFPLTEKYRVVGGGAHP